LVRRDGSGSTPLLTLAFDGDVLMVSSREGGFQVAVGDEGDVIGAVHAWLEKLRPQPMGLAIPRHDESIPRLMDGIKEILHGYATEYGP
jgi:hypothetical protein